MPILPHNFPTLRQQGPGNHRPSVLMLGAGMSYGAVSLPGPLLAEKRANAESLLGCTSAVPVDPNPTPNQLYQWADDMMTQLVARGDVNPKLTLAESLDIPKEDRWRGLIATQRNTPRHRVVARFARERLWDQIWSLNWDCVQESALENVGIKRGASDARMPWPNVFNTFITAAECGRIGEANSVAVLKPHGCVMALVDAQQARDSGNIVRSGELSERFLITASELESLAPAVASTPAQQFVFASLCVNLCSKPFIVAGWSASERYLIDHINTSVRPTLLNPHRQPPLAPDELSIIDRRFNTEGHASLAAAYGRNAASVHIDVGQAEFTTDDLFIWVQGLYGVGWLRLRADPLDQVALDAIAAEINQPPANVSFVLSWVDNFLPVWVRLCWRCGLVQCETRDALPVTSDDIPLESRDEHIPWNLPHILRPELKAATRLLAALHRSGHANEWDYERFPGGFYRDFRLVIPVPVSAGGPANDLRGLKPLIDAIKQPGAGYIDHIALLFVAPDSAYHISDGTKEVLKQLVASYLSMARFAAAANIQELPLEGL